MKCLKLEVPKVPKKGTQVHSPQTTDRDGQNTGTPGTRSPELGCPNKSGNDRGAEIKMTKTEIVESVFSIVALVSLWPLIFLRWRSPWYYVYLYAVIAVLLVISVRRFRRFRRLLEEQRERQEKEERGSG